jgi:hypothetical protein
VVETRDKGELARRFESEVFQTYEIAKKVCRYNANRFLQMLSEHGGVPTARQLLENDGIAYGLTQLWKCGRLDISVEALVLKPPFRALFTELERAKARARLAELHYRPPWLES